MINHNIMAKTLCTKITSNDKNAKLNKHNFNFALKKKSTDLVDLPSTLFPFLSFLINACVANGGWVLKDLGTDPNNPNPGRWDTPISLPYPQPSHEPRPPPQTPNQAPVTLNSTFNGETIEEKPLPPRHWHVGWRTTDTSADTLPMCWWDQILYLYPLTNDTFLPFYSELRLHKWTLAFSLCAQIQLEKYTAHGCHCNPWTSWSSRATIKVYSNSVECHSKVKIKLPYYMHLMSVSQNEFQLEMISTLFDSEFTLSSHPNYSSLCHIQYKK